MSDQSAPPISTTVPSFSFASDQSKAGLFQPRKSLMRSPTPTRHTGPNSAAIELAAKEMSNPAEIQKKAIEAPKSESLEERERQLPECLEPKTSENRKDSVSDNLAPLAREISSYTCKDSAEMVVSNKYAFDDADYEILSTDKILLKVHSYRLQAASPSFIALIRGCGNFKRIPLFGDNNERANIIQILLDAIYDSEINGCDDIATAYRVITLAERWQCANVLKLFRRDLAMQALVLGPNGPSVDHLRLALKLKDYQLMSLIAQRERDASPESRELLVASANVGPSTGDEDVDRLYDTPSAELTRYETIASPTYELGGMSYTDFLRLPPTVVWAMLRSTFLARVDCCEVSVDLDRMAKQFERLLHQAYSDKIPEAAPALGPSTGASYVLPEDAISAPEAKTSSVSSSSDA